jgi:hypothetical protein
MNISSCFFDTRFDTASGRTFTPAFTFAFAKAVAKAFAAAALSAAVYLPATAQTLTQGFDDITALPGWLSINQSDPPGQAWFQGNPGIFAAQSGAADSYIAANYLSAASGVGTIANWLITPQLTVAGSTTLSFYTRSAGTPGFADTLDVLYGSGSATSGFTRTVLTVGGPAAYPTGWQEYTVTVDAAAGGRFAFRYAGSGDVNDYIGIDSVNVAMASAVPEPSSCLLFGAGLGLLGLMRQRARRLAGAAVALGAFGLLAPALSSAAPAQDGMVVVRDPVTGQLRAPTAAEFQALQAAAPKSVTSQVLAPPRVISKADGTRQVRLGQGNMVYSVVNRDGEGQLHQLCVSGPADADAALQAAGASNAGAVSTTEARHENH